MLPLFALGMVLWAHTRVHADTPAPTTPTPQAHPTAPPSEQPRETITVGLYLQNIPEIEIRSNSFTAEPLHLVPLDR